MRPWRGPRVVYSSTVMFTALTLLAVAASPEAADGPKASLAKIEAMMPRRDQPGVMAEAKKILDEALQKWPGDYGVLWRSAYWYFWQSDAPDLSNEQKSKIAKQGW